LEIIPNQGKGKNFAGPGKINILHKGGNCEPLIFSIKKETGNEDVSDFVLTTSFQPTSPPLLSDFETHLPPSNRDSSAFAFSYFQSALSPVCYYHFI
jgi:hypothetical protein